MLNLTADRLARLVEGYSGAEAIGDYVVDAATAGRMERAVVDALKAFHAKRPGEGGCAEEAVFVSVRPIMTGLTKKPAEGLFREILALLTAKKTVVRDKGLLRLSAHRAALAGADARIEQALLKLFSAGIRPPLPEEIAGLGFKREDVDRVMNYLERNGRVVRIKQGAWVSAEVIAEARERMAEFIRSNGSIKAADFRDLLGCGRKLAIEILEYFDRERVTLRSGDERTLR